MPRPRSPASAPAGRCACCSSSTNCAARSRRRSRSSIIRLRATTAASTAARARAASFCSASIVVALLIEIVQRVALGGQRAAMGFEPHAIHFRDGGDAARHASERAHIVGREQQLHVARAPAFRQLDEPLRDAGRLRDARRFERLQPRLGAIAVGGDRAPARARVLVELRLFDLAIDLEPAQLAKHRARLRGESIGLSLQRANPRRRAIGLGLRIGLRVNCNASNDDRRSRPRTGHGSTAARSNFSSAQKEPPCLRVSVARTRSVNAPIILRRASVGHRLRRAGESALH